MSTETNYDLECKESMMTSTAASATPVNNNLIGVPLPQQHSNENLLKMDTHDKYCTVNVLKKEIMKTLSAHSNTSVISTNTTTSTNPRTIQTLLPGLLRMNKNPQSPYVFMAFATPEDRSNALRLLSAMQHRKKLKWIEVEVSTHDLALTHKGGQPKRKREEHQANTNMCVLDDEDVDDDYVDEGNNLKRNYNKSKLADYAHLTLEEQHKLKYRHCWSILKSLLSYSHWQSNENEQERTKEPNGSHETKTNSIRTSLAHCVNELFYEGILPSPVSSGYRNHVNLSFGYDSVGKPALGFNKGAVLDGTAAIESVTWNIPSLLPTDDTNECECKEKLIKDALHLHCQRKDVISLTTHHMARLIATAIMQVCNIFTWREMVKNYDSIEKSNGNEPEALDKGKVVLHVYDKIRDFGFWRKVQIRHNVEYEAMVTITVNECEYEWFDFNNKKQCSNNNDNNESCSEIEHNCTNANEFKHEVKQTIEKAKKSIVQVLTSDSFIGYLQDVCECSSAKVVSIHYCTLSPVPDTKSNLSDMKETLDHIEEIENVDKVEENTQMTLIHENGKNYEQRDTILFGSATLTEYLCNYRFELSPASFFQVNTPGMERLLNTLIHRANLQVSQSTLLDLCCGTGTIGLVLSQYVKRVVGIELVPEAVINARANGALNHITNATFHVGRVEHVLPSVIQSLISESSSAKVVYCKTTTKEKDEEKKTISQKEEHNEESSTIVSDDDYNNDSNAIGIPEKDEFIAILDPPRAGVNSTVIKWIRGTMAITKVIYISCDQNALLRDCPLLTKLPSKAYRGKPFQYTAAFAVDLFPHTRHVEMIVVLSR